MIDPRILPFYTLDSGCDYHRIILPFLEAGYELKDHTVEEFSKVKVIVFNRLIHDTFSKVQTLKFNIGMKMVSDIDDYWYLYRTHYLTNSWNSNNVPQRIEEHLKIADLVTCTTERLAGLIRSFNSNVHVIPNSIPFRGQFVRNTTDCTSKGIRFGFVGGSSHLGDIRSIAYALEHFPQLEMTMAGYAPKNSQSRGMAAILGHNGKNPNFRTILNSSLESYMSAYDTIDCCIAPLMNEEFNKYKSNLKVLEAGAKKCAIICSANECYTDTVPDTVVTYCKTIKDWKQAIKKHQDRDYTKERGEKLHEWVKVNYNMDTINPKRFKLLTDLLPYEKMDAAPVVDTEVSLVQN